MSALSMALGRQLRAKVYYAVPEAGRRVGWSKSESYRQVELGTLPIVRHGKLMLVPKRKWDRMVKLAKQGR
jgi:hypothetical protein